MIDVQSVVVRATKLKFLTGRACGRDQMERMNVFGLEADLKER